MCVCIRSSTIRKRTNISTACMNTGTIIPTDTASRRGNLTTHGFLRNKNGKKAGKSVLFAKNHLENTATSCIMKPVN